MSLASEVGKALFPVDRDLTGFLAPIIASGSY